jgi:hypothetical protein
VLYNINGHASVNPLMIVHINLHLNETRIKHNVDTHLYTVYLNCGTHALILVGFRICYFLLSFIFTANNCRFTIFGFFRYEVNKNKVSHQYLLWPQHWEGNVEIY